MLSRFVPHRAAFVAIEAWVVLLARLTKARQKLPSFQQLNIDT